MARHRLGSLMLCCASLWSTGARVAQAQARVQTRIISNVELVRVPFIIFDEQGRIATDLKKGDFRLFEDGVEQRIVSLERERLQVSFVILADLSSSMTRKIPFVQDAALSLLDPVQQRGPKCDEYSVLSISTRSRVLVPFTCDQQDLERRLPFLLTATEGSTSLFDAVWLGVDRAEEEAANRRRAMIVITDGGDNHSRYSLRETEKMLDESDFPIFAVMAGSTFELPSFSPPSQRKPRGLPGEEGGQPQFPNLPFFSESNDYIGPAEQRGPHNMKVLTEASGGGVFTARHEEDIIRIVQTIGLAVRYQYVLTYEPSRDDPFERKGRKVTANPTVHVIHLELHPKKKFAKYSMPYYKREYRSDE
jgi:VWFA-related protein